ncbi:MAG TPA: family 16 glycosylhydrolase [Anaerolineae bacterium]|nr:family 16 glycosylhydrolase [Anaerolineae bacterium]
MKRWVRLTPFAPDQALPSPWNSFVKGSGVLEAAGSTLRLLNGPTATKQYTNAQIDDYQRLSRGDFLWRPPLWMTVRARFSHPAGTLRGTAGFGFWNDPFLMTGLRRPALPRVVWFFYSSPPSWLKLDLTTPGCGWKAATLDAIRWPFFALLPTAPVAVPLMNIGWLYRTFWPVGQRAIHVSERLVPVNMTHWHTYQIDWQERRVRFTVDNYPVLDCDTSPRGPLGFVLWLDNQYMVVTPWGKLGYGLVAGDSQQWLEISQLEIESE